MPASPLRYCILDSPLGPLLLAGRDGVLTSLRFPARGGPAAPPPGALRDEAGFGEAARQLEAYFAGTLTAFDLPVHLDGAPFGQRVWAALSDIPYGRTESYGDLARRIGEGVAASRAVGAACGENPVPIIVPCHRVIGADGSLVGFGGGLSAKRFLLALERRVNPPTGAQFDLFG